MKIILTLLLLLPAVAVGNNLTCKFVKMSRMSGTSQADLSFTVSINDSSKKAIIESKNKKHEYDILSAGNYITMLQQIVDGSEGGTLRTVTIDKKLNVVYSMHGLFVDELINSSQYYGTCKQTENR